ncbi:dienelactone hydrolase family protein [Pararoseomonas indoligenes]|uniref:Dienelactone hydrolase family protein n=1 Tax=Roseomonas indoligenes TaxID=2820811 RepID=A0A940MXL5_9PROT|nr:dienelactone hydrolase family protein [Pararoseomonas indoligenes]MBP0493553.1 dienelactone hydrolase family protein [Pararoseomonas indoligenes]
MPSHRRHLALTLLAVSLAAGPQARAEDSQSVLVLSLAQAVEPPRLVPALLTLPSQKADGPPFPAVILVADAYEMDGRVAELSEILVEEGWATLQIDLDANSPDGHLASGTEIAMAADDAWAGAQQLTDVLAHLAERREIDARRVAVVGLGSGGRLALLAGADEVAYPVLGPYGPRFVAHAALYPGCAALLDDGYARPQPWTSAPAALFVPGQDTREPPGRCEALRRELTVAGRPAARWHDYPTASYGWDIGAAYGTRTVLLPLPGGGRIRTEADAGVAVDAAERLVSFLHPLLGRPGSR